MNIDPMLVDWSRAQFALTAIYHWLFVPLTLGLSIIIAIMETAWVRTGDEEWKKITRFWMILFGINFAIGIATGIILEFEFGTNWSNYSWFVGDIFGAPLATEGILAFFLESTFVVVMFFGWNKVSRRFHLVSTWLVAAGASLSALWILIANAWMQNPVGMTFNPETARNEMADFWLVVSNSVAVEKFLHTVLSGFVLASMFVMGISSWYLIKKREELLAKRSILIAAIFGLASSLFLAFTGDSSARTIARIQPVKFASFEVLVEGKQNAPLVAFGILKRSDIKIGKKEIPEFAFKIGIPDLLSVMTSGDKDAYVPGLIDRTNGNASKGIMSVAEKMERGKIAHQALLDYKTAKAKGENENAAKISRKFADKDFRENYFRYFGYSFLNSPEDVIPDIYSAFYSFHFMVILGFFFILIFSIALFYSYNGTIINQRWFLWIALWSIPLPYIASELGWILTEVGRQPWIVQDLMPVSVAVTNIETGAVQTTFWIFAFIFTALLVADISILLRQIKIGPKH